MRSEEWSHHLDDNERHYRTEADRVATTRPRCDLCGEDPDFIFTVCVRAYDLDGQGLLGKRICDVCIGRQGFTGWAFSSGGWLVRDLLGRSRAPEADCEPPPDWRVIAAALEGRVPAAVR